MPSLEVQGENTLGALRLLTVIAVLFVSTAASGSETIVNVSLQRDSVSLALLRGIFGMRVRLWPDGTPVRVFVLRDDDPEHAAFCKRVLRMYPYQLRQAWDRLVYSGTGQPPIEVTSIEEMRRRVAETTGAIGYLPSAQEAGAHEQIKVLHVR